MVFSLRNWQVLIKNEIRGFEERVEGVSKPDSASSGMSCLLLIRRPKFFRMGSGVPMNHTLGFGRGEGGGLGGDVAEMGRDDA